MFTAHGITNIQHNVLSTGSRVHKYIPLGYVMYMCSFFVFVVLRCRQYTPGKVYLSGGVLHGTDDLCKK